MAKTTNTLLTTARRIAELARRGEDGERVNAERILADFMAKHAITDADLIDSEEKDYRFDAPKEMVECMLASQCITSSADTTVYTIKLKNSSKVKFLEARLTAAQYAEASMKMAVMLPIFREEQRTFFHAFLFANQLLGKGKSDRKWTEEELQHFRRAKSMSMFVKRGEVHKALDIPKT
jgi:hypothetical protein